MWRATPLWALDPSLLTGQALGRAARMRPGLRSRGLYTCCLKELALGRATRLGPGLRNHLLDPSLLTGQALGRAVISRCVHREEAQLVLDVTPTTASAQVHTQRVEARLRPLGRDARLGPGLTSHLHALGEVFARALD